MMTEASLKCSVPIRRNCKYTKYEGQAKGARGYSEHSEWFEGSRHESFALAATQLTHPNLPPGVHPHLDQHFTPYRVLPNGLLISRDVPVNMLQKDQQPIGNCKFMC